MKNTKKIVHILTSMNVGGAETFIMNLYRNIDREVIQFNFILHTDKECYYDKEIKSLGGKIINIPGPEVVGVKKYRKILGDALDECGQVDGVHAHAHFFNGIILNVAKRKGIKIRVSHSHSSQDGVKQSCVRKLYRGVMRALISHSATDLLSCSDKASNELYGMKNDKVIFVPNSIKFDLYKNTSLDLRKELNINSESMIVGHVGSFKDVKNHGYIIKVFNEINKTLDKAELVLVGDGELREKVQKEVKELGLESKVHFLGIRGDVCDIIQNFDLFLFPSKFEGLPVSLVEVQAAKIRAIVSDNITKDLLFTKGLINYVSLDEFSLWVEKSIDILKNSDTYNKEKINFENSDFDIENLVEKLMDIYLR